MENNPRSSILFLHILGASQSDSCNVEIWQNREWPSLGSMSLWPWTIGSSSEFISHPSFSKTDKSLKKINSWLLCIFKMEWSGHSSQVNWENCGFPHLQQNWPLSNEVLVHVHVDWKSWPKISQWVHIYYLKHMYMYCKHGNFLHEDTDHVDISDLMVWSQKFPLCENNHDNTFMIMMILIRKYH